MLKLPDYIASVIERGGTVVVPSRQRAHALRLAHAAAQLARGQRAWSSPDVLPLEGWLMREIERYAANGGNAQGEPRRVPRLLSAAEEWLLWRQCTAEATGGLELINRSALAESLRRASGLAAQLSIDLRAIREPSGSETDLLATVHRALMQRCEALGAAPLAAALPSLPCVGDERPVLFAGFLPPSPRLRSIAAARAQYALETSFPPPAVAPLRVTPLIETPADEREELERIAEWCQRRLTAQADSRLLVLLPGSAGRRERAAALIQQGFSSEALVAIEGGQPLASQPMIAHALGALALLAGEALGTDRLLEWLRAPWWAEPGPAARAALDLWLREQGRLRLELTSLLALLRRVPAALVAPARAIITRLEQAAGAVRLSSGSPREWSERFAQALEILDWPGARTRGSAEQQILARFHELLEELGQLSAVSHTLTVDVATRWLAERASLTPYRPSDDDAAVTISPSYADPVARYEGVWVAGLGSEAFPQPVAPDPFLPLAAQVAAGWPAATAAGRLEEARALIAAWRAAAGELVLSAPARAEDIELLPSPLLEEWRSTPRKPAKTRRPVWLPARLHRPGLLTEWRDDAGVPWSSELPLPAGTRSLELQNQCPFRAYAELRLGSQELGVPEPGIAPDARGKLLHDALQKLWDRLGDSRALTALERPALGELIDTCVAAAAATLEAAGEESLARPALARECRRTARLIGKLLEIERGRAPFSVRHTEYVSQLRLAGRELRLRIDRLDTLASGGIAILDYKSGRRVSPDWYGERPSHPQLLAYLAAVGEEVVALATVNVTAKEVRFDGIAASGALLPKVPGVKAAAGQSQQAWQERVLEWRGLLERLATAFAAGQATVDPKPHACDFCHVASVCRIGDSLIPTDDELVEEGPGAIDDE